MRSCNEGEWEAGEAVFIVFCDVSLDLRRAVAPVSCPPIHERKENHTEFLAIGSLPSSESKNIILIPILLHLPLLRSPSTRY